MKRIFALLLLAALLLSMTACFGSGQNDKTEPSTEGSSATTGTTENQPTGTTAPSTSPSESTGPTETIAPPHDKFDLEAAAEVIGTWRLDVAMTGDMMGMEGFQCEVKFPLLYTFAANGEMKVSFDEENLETAVESFRDALKTYTVDLMYQEFEAQGLDKETADAAFMDTYNTTVSDYVNTVVDAVDYASLFAMFISDGIYYVEGDKLYSGSEGSETFEINTFKVEADQGMLYLLDSSAPDAWAAMGMEFPIELKKVAN